MKSNRAYTIVEVLVAISVISILIAICMPAIEGAREAARRLACGNNLRQIGLAVSNYHATNGCFPAMSDRLGVKRDAGPRHAYPKQYSVFTQVLPDLEQGPLYHSINFDVSLRDGPLYPFATPRPGHSEANVTAMQTSLAVLLCPSDALRARTGPAVGTNYRANFGTHLFDTTNPSHNGPFSGRTPISSSDVPDGLSHTAAFCEKLRGDASRVALDPRVDLLIDPESPHIDDPSFARCANQPAQPGHYVTSTGTRWMVATLTQTLYNHLDRPNSPVPDCGVTGYDPIPGRVAPRSNHPSGVNVALADGSVRFVTNTIGLATWSALGTRAGAEIGHDY